MDTPHEITKDLYAELHQLATRVTKPTKPRTKKTLWALAATGAVTVAALGVAVWKTPTLSTKNDQDPAPKTPPTSQ